MSSAVLDMRTEAELGRSGLSKVPGTGVDARIKTSEEQSAEISETSSTDTQCVQLDIAK